MKIAFACPFYGNTHPLVGDSQRANIDQLSASVGMLLESQEQLTARVSQVHDEFLGHARVAVDCNSYIVAALRKLGGENA